MAEYGGGVHKGTKSGQRENQQQRLEDGENFVTLYDPQIFWGFCCWEVYNLALRISTWKRGQDRLFLH